MTNCGSQVVLHAVAWPANAGRSIPGPVRARNEATLTATTRILRALEGAAAGLSPATIALRAGVPKPTAEAVLAALEAERFVERVPACRRFRIGRGLLRIAASAGETTRENELAV